jgi:hypothetical protein
MPKSSASFLQLFACWDDPELFSFLTSIQPIYACPWWKTAFRVTQCHIKCQHSTVENLNCNTEIRRGVHWNSSNTSYSYR